MSREHNTVQADVVVVRVHGKKELSTVSWEVNLGGEVDTFKNHGSLLVTPDGQPGVDRIRELEAKHGVKLDLWHVAEKAVKLAKLPKSEYKRAKTRLGSLPLPPGVALEMEKEQLPVIVSITCDLEGRVLSSAQSFWQQPDYTAPGN